MRFYLGLDIEGMRSGIQIHGDSGHHGLARKIKPSITVTNDQARCPSTHACHRFRGQQRKKWKGFLRFLYRDSLAWSTAGSTIAYLQRRDAEKIWVKYSISQKSDILSMPSSLSATR